MTGHPEVPQPVRVMKVTTDGDCAECSEPIAAGDLAVLRTDDSYTHGSHYSTITIIRWEHDERKP